MRASIAPFRWLRVSARQSLLLLAGLLFAVTFGLASTPAAAQTFTFYEVIVPGDIMSGA